MPKLPRTRLPQAADLPPACAELHTLETRQPGARLEVARAWARRSAQEHAASLQFARIAQGVGRHGCPAELHFLAQRSVADELRHSALCELLARRYVLDIEVPPVPTTLTVEAGQVEHADALFILANCCVNESIAVAFLEASRDHASTPATQFVVRELLQDEVDHARLGWGFLAWLFQDQPEAHVEVQTHLRVVVAHGARDWLRVGPPAADPPAGHGLLSEAQRVACARDALNEVVFPGLEHLGLDASECRAWVASVAAAG